jgi:hypothetical protein
MKMTRRLGTPGLGIAETHRNQRVKLIQITLEQDVNPIYWGNYLIDCLACVDGHHREHGGRVNDGGAGWYLMLN